MTMAAKDSLKDSERSISSEESWTTVTIHKKYAEDRLGITFSRAGNGLLRLKSVSAGGLVSQQQAPFMVPGMLIKSINGIDCCDLTASDLSLILKSAAGDLTFTVTTPAEWTTVRVHKAAVDDTLGITFARYGDSDLFVKNIRPNGMLARTSLLEGMVLLNIHGVDCGGLSAKDASLLLKQTEGDLVIYARMPKEKSFSSLVVPAAAPVMTILPVDNGSNVQPNATIQCWVGDSTSVFPYTRHVKVTPSLGMMVYESPELTAFCQRYISPQVTKARMFNLDSEPRYTFVLANGASSNSLSLAEDQTAPAWTHMNPVQKAFVKGAAEELGGQVAGTLWNALASMQF